MNQPAITTTQAIDQLEEADQEAMAAEREVAAGVLLLLGVPSWVRILRAEILTVFLMDFDGFRCSNFDCYCGLKTLPRPRHGRAYFTS